MRKLADDGGSRVRDAMILSTILFSALINTSCDVHEFPDEQGQCRPDKKITLEMNLLTGSMPVYQVVNYDSSTGQITRTAESPVCFRYLIDIYLAGDSRFSGTRSFPILTKKIVVPVPLEESVERLSLSLPSGKYTAVIWADYADADGDDLYYNTLDRTAISLTSPYGECHPGNVAEREAFRGEIQFTVASQEGIFLENGSQVEILKVDLERPMAKFRFVATDVAEFLTRVSSAFHSEKMKE